MSFKNDTTQNTDNNVVKHTKQAGRHLTYKVSRSDTLSCMRKLCYILLFLICICVLSRCIYGCVRTEMLQKIDNAVVLTPNLLLQNLQQTVLVNVNTVAQQNVTIYVDESNIVQKFLTDLEQADGYTKVIYYLLASAICVSIICVLTFVGSMLITGIQLFVEYIRMKREKQQGKDE